MESSLNLDLGELQNLLQSLTSPTIPSSNQISIPNPLPIQVQAPISIQSQDLNSQVYQQSVYNQTYHSNFHQIPTHHQYQTNSSSSSTTTTTSSSLSALLSNLSSPVNPIFSQPLPSSSSSSTNDIFNLINALQPTIISFNQIRTTPSTAKSSISRSRDDFNQDSSTSMPCPKKLKLASPPLSPISPREDTPDLSYTHQNPIHSHFSSSGMIKIELQSTSISPDPSTSTFKPSPPPPIE
ncbi:hypothetical protein DFH28DRAFT_959696 [Melampsora americana]|nr:hypothetical protein DFH28DRAFT_959696 [Melampsora americana]